MIKTFLTYFIFVITCIGLIAAFITATTVTQLGVAILLYPLLIFFTYKIFSHKNQKNFSKNQVTMQPPLQEVPSQQAKPTEIVEEFNKENMGISDINKRAFLKILGATGISFFLISIFSRRIESLVFSQNLVSQPAPIGNPPQGDSNNPTASPTDGYKISEVDDGVIGYYGFINKNGGWFIMKSATDTGSFRYARGESNFPSDWNNRKNLKYDYYHIIFP